MVDPALTALGFGVGLLIGLTGMGGASLTTPLLILGLGVQPIVAVGTDLVYAAVTKLAGAWQHLRQGTVDVRLGLRLSLGSVPGALLGTLAVSWAHDRFGPDLDGYLVRLIGLVLVVSSAMMLARCLGVRLWPAAPALLRHPAMPVVAGALVGFTVGLTSVGSGTLVIALLASYSRLPGARLVGTDVFHGAILVATAGLAHLASGNVDVTLAGNLLLGSVPGVMLGSQLSPRIPERFLRPTLAAVLLASGLRLT